MHVSTEYQDEACLLCIFSAKSPIFPEVIYFEFQRKCPPCTLTSSTQRVWVPCGFTGSTSALGPGAQVGGCPSFGTGAGGMGGVVLLLPLPAWWELAEQQQQGQNAEMMIRGQRCQEGWWWWPLFSQYPLETAALCTHSEVHPQLEW